MAADRKPARRVPAWLDRWVLAAVAIAATVMLVASSEDAPAPRSAKSNPPASVGVPTLRSLSQSSGAPVYWAGRPDAGGGLQLERRPGQVTVRYPSAGGSGSRTVGTYRLADAKAAVRRAARSQTATLHRLRGRGLAVSDSARPTNVFFAYGNQPFQVEVYDPRPGQALRLVLAGRVVPVR